MASSGHILLHSSSCSSEKDLQKMRLIWTTGALAATQALLLVVPLLPEYEIYRFIVFPGGMSILILAGALFARAACLPRVAGLLVGILGVFVTFLAAFAGGILFMDYHPSGEVASCDGQILRLYSINGLQGMEGGVVYVKAYAIGYTSVHRLDEGFDIAATAEPEGWLVRTLYTTRRIPCPK